MSYSVRLLSRAKADLLRIFFYIEERSPEGALRWEEALEAGLDRLRGNPSIYGLAPEDSHFDFELRQLLFKTKQGRTYRAVYRIDRNQVIVFRICGPGQAPLSPDELPLG